jgi:hypothetical protein
VKKKKYTEKLVIKKLIWFLAHILYFKKKLIFLI